MAQSHVPDHIQWLDLAAKLLKDSKSRGVAASSSRLLAILDILPPIQSVDEYIHLPLPAPATRRAHLPPNTPVSLTEAECRACAEQFRRENDTVGQFWSMKHELVVATMDRLRFGNSNRNRKGFTMAIRNRFGCLLAQKKTNKAGYPQIRPIAEIIKVGTGRAPQRQPLLLQQLGHRLAMLEIGERPAPIYGQKEHHQTICEVLEAGGLEISHLCHYNICINTDHMVFEDARTNSQRNSRRGKEYCICNQEPRCLVGSYGERRARGA